MNTNSHIVVGFASLALLFVGLIAFVLLAPGAAGVVSNTEDQSARAFAVEFASKFKNVSLLAEDLSAQLSREYGAYVTPELLVKWQSREEEAPGRYTSSPWPDRMEAVEVKPLAGGAYSVSGNVIEVTSADTAMEPAAVYPVTMTLQRNGSTWVVTTFEKGAYSPLPARVSVVGYWECLPHRDTTGPQTLECAFGIALDQSDGHLAVNTQLMSTYPVDVPAGTKVRIEGVLTPIEMLSSDHWQKYDVDGILSATSITKL